MDDPSAAPGTPGRPPPTTFPWIPVVAATVVVVLAVTAFLYFFVFKRTTGPGQVLREYYLAVHNHDCPRSYELLAAEVRARVTAEGWCEALQEVDYPATFTVEAVALQADVATVTVREPGGPTLRWPMEREGDSWRVRQFPGDRNPIIGVFIPP